MRQNTEEGVEEDCSLRPDGGKCGPLHRSAFCMLLRRPGCQAECACARRQVRSQGTSWRRVAGRSRSAGTKPISVGTDHGIAVAIWVRVPYGRISKIDRFA